MDAIRPYTAADEASVAALLVAAFHDDPGWVHIFPTERRAALRFLMPRLLRMRVPKGSALVCERDGQVAGALIALPSSVRFGLGTYVRHGLLRMPFNLGVETVMRMLSSDREVHDLRATVSPPVHHEHIAQLAVHPDFQGKGVGSALIRQFIANHGSVPVSLITTKSDNVIWYEKFGFQIAGQCGIQQSFTAWCLVLPAS